MGIDIDSYLFYGIKVDEKNGEKVADEMVSLPDEVGYMDFSEGDYDEVYLVSDKYFYSEDVWRSGTFVNPIPFSLSENMKEEDEKLFKAALLVGMDPDIKPGWYFGVRNS